MFSGTLGRVPCFKGILGYFTGKYGMLLGSVRWLLDGWSGGIVVKYTFYRTIGPKYTVYRTLYHLIITVFGGINR